MKGIQQASPLDQTSCLEGFHSVLNHFAPKMISEKYIADVAPYGKIKRIRSDNGGEFISYQFKGLLRKQDKCAVLTTSERYSRKSMAMEKFV